MDKIEERALTISEQAMKSEITTADQYVAAGELWKTLAGLEKEIKDTFGPLKKKASDAHKAVVAKEKEHLGPIEKAKRYVKQIMGDWDDEQERIRREKQRQLEEKLRKEAEDQKLADAIAAEDAGDLEEAEAILSEETEAPVVELQKQTPKLSGGPVYRENWTFEIEDETKIPREFLVPDNVKIGQVVRAMKSQTKIPGIRAFSRRV